MCLALPRPVLVVVDSAALESMRSRIGTTLPRFGKHLNSHRLSGGAVASVHFCFGISASAVLVATMLCCFVQALIRCFPSRIMPPLTDFLGCLSPAQIASVRACKALG